MRPQVVLGLTRKVRQFLLASLGTYAQYAVSIVALPLLARTLGPSGLGFVAISGAGYAIGSILCDLGVSPTFAAYNVRLSSRASLSVIANRYRTYKYLVLLTSLIACAVGDLLQCPFALEMLLLGSAAGAASSVPDLWLLYSRSRFSSMATAQVVTQGLYLLFLVTGLKLHRSPEVVPLAQLASYSLSTILVASITHGDFEIDSARMQLILTRGEVARLAIPAASARGLNSAYSQSAPAIFSLVLGATGAGLFTASDRLVHAVQAGFDPLATALLPTHAKQQSTRQLWLTTRRLVAISGLLALAISTTIACSATVIVEGLYGSDYQDSIGLLRVQAFLLPFGVASSVVDMLFLRVIGDTTTTLIASAGALGVLGAGLGVAGATGSVIAAAATTVIGEAAFLIVALWRGRAHVLDERRVQSET